MGGAEVEPREFVRRWLPLIVVYGIYAVGTASHIHEGSRDLMLSMTPYVLLVMGLFVMHPDMLDRNWTLLWWATLVYVVTFTLEGLGVATGLVFGEYAYGNTLGLKAASVPLVIGFNWVLVVLGGIVIAQRFTDNVWLVALVAAALTTAFDVAMEPVAMALDYWDWDVGHVPLQNYVAWFVISFAVALSYGLLRLRTGSQLYAHYFAVQLVFFLVIGPFV